MSTNGDADTRIGRQQTLSLWRGVGFTMLFNGLLVLWQLVRPANHALFILVDNVAQSAGPLLMVFACAPALWRLWRHARTDGPADAALAATRRWVPILLCLSILSFVVGQAIWTIYQVLNQQPFPSWADAAFLSEYPLLLLGILLLPTAPLPAETCTRVALDGLMVMTAAITFSWYFILGPTVLQGGETVLAKVVGSTYPLCDLVVIYCLLRLSARSGDSALPRVVLLLTLAFAIIVVTDSVFDLQNLHGTYATGGLVDVGWPLGYMLEGVAIRLLSQGMVTRRARSAESRGAEPSAAGAAASRTPQLWRSLVPFALVPAVMALLIYVWRSDGDVRLETGVYIGGTLLIGLVLIRQVLAIVENRRLYGYLHDAYRQLEANNSATLAHARNTEQLYRELHAVHAELEAHVEALAKANAQLETLATTDPLTGLPNHRSIVASVDHELEHAQRHGYPCVLLFLDLDHFKALNDGFGHPAGDAALRDFGALIGASLRGMDTVGRWGGEEFVALLPETDLDGALLAAERIRAAVAAHPFAVGNGAHLTCSIGVAAYPDDALDRDGLIAAADQAMYAAKRFGRNQVRSAGEAAVAALAAETGKFEARNDSALVGTVEALAALVEARDRYTGRHVHDVASLSLRLALALGLDTTEAHITEMAGRLHDVGKVAVPDTVLQKPGRLSDEEWALMRMHPEAGADVVARVPALRAVAPLIRAHHERWDGRGYPDGLAGEAIPLGARILAVADSYRAMTSDRPYRTARTPAQTLAELQRCAGTQFDPAVVAALERALAAAA